MSYHDFNINMSGAGLDWLVRAIDQQEAACPVPIEIANLRSQAVAELQHVVADAKVKPGFFSIENLAEIDARVAAMMAARPALDKAADRAVGLRVVDR
jgi:hypothetical protein